MPEVNNSQADLGKNAEDRKQAPGKLKPEGLDQRLEVQSRTKKRRKR